MTERSPSASPNGVNVRESSSEAMKEFDFGVTDPACTGDRHEGKVADRG